MLQGAQHRIRELENNIEKRDSWITTLQCSLSKQTDEVQARDDMVKQLSQTILKKAKQNQRLS